MPRAICNWVLTVTATCLMISCTGKTQAGSESAIAEMNLKSGALISCGPAEGKLGTLDFPLSCGEKVRDDFNLAVKLLHSFEYDEAEKVFARVIAEEPGCAMAYWGVAMSNFHPLWTPPTEAELKKGARAISLADAIPGKPEREDAYLQAIAAYYTGWEQTDHRSRSLRFEQAMERLASTYPDDREATIFYALALTAAADPADKTFAKQKKAGAILSELYKNAPEHPGVIHYLIHAYDVPGLAQMALPAARKYASVAPASAHALHMPSHIFTRMGLWNECINANLASVASAKCYAQQAGLKGHWDEELHGLDYLVYAYLQQGNNKQAKQQLDYLLSMKEVQPANFKVAYAFAAIPSRYLLENRQWKEAAVLEVRPVGFSWEAYPWQEAIIRFTRLMGNVRTGNTGAARVELAELKKLQDRLQRQKDAYKAGQVAIQVHASEAWIRLAEGKKEEAVRLMRKAAEMEDKTEKHPVTPCEVVPARELLGELLLETDEPALALEAFEQSLDKNPARFNGLYGAALAAERSGRMEKAKTYYAQLRSGSAGGEGQRPELELAGRFLQAQ